jgi:nitrate/TMAO reductase-like tetraheme cytochrome c subunit
VEHPVTLSGYIALACAAIATALIAEFLVRKRALDLRSKVWLLFALGVFPALTAAASTTTGMRATTERHFCGSCHVMDRHVSDSNDPSSQSLAARHGRNALFGSQNCYVCHADYGMFGYPVTKLNGMRHVWEYYFGGYKEMTTEQAVRKIHLYEPYDNQNCRHCHTGTLAVWKNVPEHTSLRTELEANRVSCASGGCHGFAHPFNKPPKK